MTEDVAAEYVATDDDEIARRVDGVGFLDHVAHTDPAALVGHALGRHAAIGRHFISRHPLQSDCSFAARLVLTNQVAQMRTGTEQLVGQQHDERRIADHFARTHDGVPETAG